MRIRSLTAVAATVLALPACDQAPLLPDAPETAGSAAQAAVRTDAPVLTFADQTEVGTSTVVRNANGITARLATGDLEAGTAATMWIVVFNNPDLCSAPGCSEDDLFDPAVMPDVLYGSGRRIGPEGVANYAARRKVGDASGSVWAELGFDSPGILDAFAAEIHLVVRSHGPLIPGLEREMTRTFGAGCNDSPGGALGTPGPNVCSDVQFAVHLP